MSAENSIRSLVPKSLRQRLRAAHRSYTLESAFRDVGHCLDDSRPVGTDVAQRLIYGWNNEGWSAKPDLVVYLANQLRQVRGALVECGSGLSTALLARVHRQTGAAVVSLEHDATWHGLMHERLRNLGLPQQGVRLAPLREYPGFHWYDFADALHVVPQIEVVLCDGPPSRTPGGRYGLMPCLGDRLVDGAQIIVDDTTRDAEAGMVQRWIAESAGHLALSQSFPDFAVLTYRMNLT